MSLPKEPRQLMINLMYLVLTALLALNVSNEILHAFKVINESIGSSNAAISEKNGKLYKGLEDQQHQAGQEARIKPYNDKAKRVKSESEALIKFFETWKDKIIETAGGREENGDIKREDNIDASTLMLVERKGGDEIKDKLNQYRELMLTMVNPQMKTQLSNDLPVKIAKVEKSDNNPRADWSMSYFHNMPTVAVITLFSKFQNDVRNSEALIINQLAKEAGDIQVKFDEMQAIAVPKTSYALEGQKIEAQIMLAAYNKAVNPTVRASSGRVVKVENGVASWEVEAHGVGPQKVRGEVSLDLGGRVETRSYEFEYVIGSTGASMGLDKMNVFYIGVPNPVTISAAGYSLEDVYVDVPNAEVKPGVGKGHYDVMVSTVGKVEAKIFAKIPKGPPKEVGKQEIRVKRIPNPIPKVAGKSGGGLAANQFRAQLGVIADLENFDFDVKYAVTEFKYSIQPKKGEYIGPFSVKGPRFDNNPDIMKAKDRLKPGDRVFIEEIKAIGPDKKSRDLNPISFLLF